MAVVPFGFGLGDIITAIQLIIDGVKALDDSRGAKKSFSDLVVSLSPLLDVCVTLDNMQLPDELHESYLSIKRHVERCRSLIADFVLGIEKYQPHLMKAKAFEGWWDKLKKIKWTLCKPKDVELFLMQLSRQQMTLQTCLTQVLMQQNALMFAKIGQYSSQVSSLEEDLRTHITDLKIANHNHTNFSEKSTSEVTSQLAHVYSRMNEIISILLPPLISSEFGVEGIKQTMEEMRNEIKTFITASRVGKDEESRDTERRRRLEVQSDIESSNRAAQESDISENGGLGVPSNSLTTGTYSLNSFNPAGKIWRNQVQIKGIGTVYLVLSRSTRLCYRQGSSTVSHARIEFVPVSFLRMKGFNLEITFGRDDQWANILLKKSLVLFTTVPKSSRQVLLARIGHYRELRKMFDDLTASPTDRDTEGNSLLHISFYNGRWDTCNMLLREGVDIHATNKYGTVTELFHELAAEDIWSLNRPYKTAADVSFELRREFGRLLEEKSVDLSPAESNNFSWVSRFNDIRTTFSLQSEYGDEIGSLRFWYGHVDFYEGKELFDIVSTLAETYKAIGVDLDVQDSDGMTSITALALHATHSYWQGFVALLSGLLHANYNPNSRTAKGENAFHMALYGCIHFYTTEQWEISHDEVQNALNLTVRVLWGAGCELLAEDNEGRTPTQLALHLSKLTGLDMYSTWVMALKSCGVEFERLLAVEAKLQHHGLASGTDSSYYPDSQKVRLRKWSAENNDATSECYNAANRTQDNRYLCRCTHCVFRKPPRVVNKPSREEDVLGVYNSTKFSFQPTVWYWYCRQKGIGDVDRREFEHMCNSYRYHTICSQF